MAISIRGWLREGARTLLLQPANWRDLSTGPGTLATLVLAIFATAIAFQRLAVSGEATFHWDVVNHGWLSFVLFAWACLLVVPHPLPKSAEGRSDPALAPSATHLLTLLMAQKLHVSLLVGALYALLVVSGALQQLDAWVGWAFLVVPLAWSLTAIALAVRRAGPPGHFWRRFGAAVAVILAFALTYFLARSPSFWRAPVSETEEVETPFAVTQAVIEAQAPTLAARTGALAPQRPGVIDMYTITFAPFEGEEVFRRESNMVADVMARRFDATARGLQLINHRDTFATLPWATPLNLQRAIEAVAAVMDPEEDILFIHLTSHGADNGELAANFWPLEIEPVVPPDLKQWLDQAGVRYRVISVSACYAGNWIGPLSDPATLVMTASDADHTSYGCGKKSDLTFFGRAMYDEQLRNRTLSFEDAHAAARKVILQREKEAGKDDGYSNPQIAAGPVVRLHLQRLREQLARRANKP